MSAALVANAGSSLSHQDFRPERSILCGLVSGGSTSKVWRACGGSRPRQVPEFACPWRCGAWFAIGGLCRLELLTRISSRHLRITIEIATCGPFPNCFAHDDEAVGFI